MGFVELSLAVLENGAAGKAGGDDVCFLEFLGGFSWECAQQGDARAGDLVLAHVFGAVTEKVLIVDVV